MNPAAINHTMHSDLYSPQLERRYRATLAEDGTVLPKKWPVACYGASNAFLALLGPSPGGANADEAIARGGANRPHRYSMRIGRNLQDFNFNGKKDPRTARWTRLCAEILGEESCISAMTALLNLDWRHSTSENAIPQEDLAAGFTRYVWPLLQQLRPRIVCVLSNRTWDTIYPQIRDFEIALPRFRFSLADSCGVKPSREPLVFKLPDCDFPSLLIKPHRHPSRALSYEQISIIGRSCRRFLQKA